MEGEEEGGAAGGGDYWTGLGGEGGEGVVLCGRGRRRGMRGGKGWEGVGRGGVRETNVCTTNDSKTHALLAPISHTTNFTPCSNIAPLPFHLISSHLIPSHLTHLYPSASSPRPP